MANEFQAYGRVANLKSEPSKVGKSEQDKSQGNLIDHYTSLLLAVFFDAGLLEVGQIIG